MPKLNLICTSYAVLNPADDEATAWLNKHKNTSVSAKIETQRSPEHNRMFWSVATKTFENLPEKYEGQWSDKRGMVKGLQMAFGICDQIKKPTKGGWEIVQVPKSLDFGNMEQDEFNEVSEKLFRGMAHMLGIDVVTLLDEGRV